MLTVRVYGLKTVTDAIGRGANGVEDAIRAGCRDAGEYLQDAIIDQFGSYRSGWDKLKYPTVVRERKLGYGANATKPLVMSGDMMMSFETKVIKEKGSIYARIQSNDKKIKYHVYGAPRAGVPQRDPIKPVAKEQADECVKIFEETFIREMNKLVDIQ